MGGIRVALFQADERWQPYPGTYAQHYAFPIEWEAVDEWFAHMKRHGVNLEIHPAGTSTAS